MDYDSTSRAVLMMEVGHQSIPMVGIISRPKNNQHGAAMMDDIINEVLRVVENIPLGRYHLEHVTPDGRLRRRTTGFRIISDTPE